MGSVRVLLVGCRPCPIVRMLERVAKSASWEMLYAESTRRARRILACSRPDLHVLSLEGMESRTACRWCGEIRADPLHAHVGLVLLGPRLEPGDEHVLRLRCGADACLRHGTLTRARLERLFTEVLGCVAGRRPCRLSVGPLVLCRQQRVAWLEDAVLPLKDSSFRRLELLATAYPEDVTYARLLDRRGGRSWANDAGVAHVEIRRIRKILGQHSRMIRNTRGVGYRLVVT